MESYINLFIAFSVGFLAHVIWNRMVNFGYTLIIMRSLIADSLMIVAKNMQSLYEINHLKKQAWKLLEMDDKYIEFQEQVDTKEITSIQNTIIRNFINSIPPKYNYLIEFHDWNSALEYIDKSIKRRRR